MMFIRHFRGRGALIEQFAEQDEVATVDWMTRRRTVSMEVVQ